MRFVVSSSINPALSLITKHCAKSKMNQNQRFCQYKTSKNEVYRERKALDENCKGSM